MTGRGFLHDHDWEVGDLHYLLVILDCAGVSFTHFESLSTSATPFHCVACFYNDELADLKYFSRKEQRARSSRLLILNLYVHSFFQYAYEEEAAEVRVY